LSGFHQGQQAIPPAQQAGYRTAAYLFQHTQFVLGKREASI
jgi:hypothetical protein